MSDPLQGRHLACLIMAAGSASRYGSSKQLADLHGKPLIKHILDAAKPVFGDHLYCVLGANADAIHSILDSDAHTIKNSQWQLGLGKSIGVGVSHLSQAKQYDGVLIVLADQYRITSEDLTAVVEQFNPSQIIATDYGRAAGVPALFPHKYFPDLVALSGDHGAKALLKLKADVVQRHNMPNARQDLDTPEDMALAQKQLTS